MSTPEPSSNWDLTPVIDLLQSYRVDDQRGRNPTTATSGEATPPAPQKRNDENAYQRLGDFAALWDFLGGPLSSRQNGRTDEEAARGPEVFGGALPLNENRDPGNSGNTGNPQSVQTGTGEASSVVDTTENAPKVVLRRPTESVELQSLPPHITSHQVTTQTSKCLGFNGTPTTKARGRQNGSKDLLSPSKRRPQVEPIISGSEEEKRRALVSRLRERCPNEGKAISNPKLLDSTFCLSNTNSKGIHVFVDASNIMVGFHDYIKTTRHIPTTCRVPRLPLSFHNLSLVLERGRPVCKRVLVGSDRFPAIYEAEQLGYETNILDRVQKTKETTPHKKKFFNGDERDPASNGQDPTSESETNAGPQLPRWVEQAVDEILHLKMLETLVDTSDPSTMVLATGDAAEAEYSEGFMRMVERALEKKWRVELVSFSCTTSRAYRRKEFRAKWSSRFIIIDLDPYAEYLLAM